MGRYCYEYQSEIRFTRPVQHHDFLLRARPCENECQHLVEDDLCLRPACAVSEVQDVFGNRVQLGRTEESAQCFCFVSRGEVELAPYELHEPVAAFYRYESPLTAISAPLRDFVAGLELEQRDPHDAALTLCHAVHQALRYEPHATDNSTSAATAFALGKGVCQDFAHVFLAAARALHLPSRYVNGFLPGEGATHAWCEYFDGRSWRAVDPTNDTEIFCGYIKVAQGRDASDCPVNRGVFVGGGTQSNTVNVVAHATPSSTSGSPNNNPWDNQ